MFEICHYVRLEMTLAHNQVYRGVPYGQNCTCSAFSPPTLVSPTYGAHASVSSSTPPAADAHYLASKPYPHSNSTSLVLSTPVDFLRPGQRWGSEGVGSLTSRGRRRRRVAGAATGEPERPRGAVVVARGRTTAGRSQICGVGNSSGRGGPRRRATG
jgi:hypothetical protein